MGGHFTRPGWRVQSSEGSLGKSYNIFLIQWTQRIWFGGRIRSKEPTLVSCPDISKWDKPWIRWGKILGAWPLSSKIINRHILLGFVLKIDATTTWKKSIFGCPHMINGTDLERSQDLPNPFPLPLFTTLSNVHVAARQIAACPRGVKSHNNFRRQDLLTGHKFDQLFWSYLTTSS